MQQRTDPEPEHSQPTSAEPAEPRGPSTADLAAVGSRPTIEPHSETPSNVTPIGTRGDGSRAMEADSRTSAGPDASGTAAIAAPGTATRPTPSPAATDHVSTLFPVAEAERFRSDWRGVQTDFVDEPRRAVEEADQLVARTITRLAEIFAEERSKLEEQWSRGDDISTEDLRLALQRYRSFFDRLLSA
jgi:hypothetical protein